MDFKIERQSGSHARFWNDVCVSSFCLGVGGLDNSASVSSQQQPISKGGSEDLHDGMTDSGIQDPASGELGTKQRGVVEEVDKDQWIKLVKVLVLTAWDLLGLEE